MSSAASCAASSIPALELRRKSASGLSSGCHFFGTAGGAARSGSSSTIESCSTPDSTSSTVASTAAVGAAALNFSPLSPVPSVSTTSIAVSGDVGVDGAPPSGDTAFVFWPSDAVTAATSDGPIDDSINSDEAPGRRDTTGPYSICPPAPPTAGREEVPPPPMDALRGVPFFLPPLPSPIGLRCLGRWPWNFSESAITPSSCSTSSTCGGGDGAVLVLIIGRLGVAPRVEKRKPKLCSGVLSSVAGELAVSASVVGSAMRVGGRAEERSVYFAKIELL